MDATLAGQRPRTEIHFHILPGIDDGPATLGESLELAERARADGTGTIVATPHVRSDFHTRVDDLPGRVADLQAEIDAAGIPVELRVGAELGHDMVGRLDQHELDSIAHGPPGARWLLVESPFAGLDEGFAAATEELRDRGFATVLAHPERALGVLDGPGLRRELAAGAVLQVNASSLLGRHGGPARDAGAQLARRHPVVLASDAHGAWKPPSLTAAVAAAIDLGVPEPLARRMAGSAPRALMLGGLALPAHAAAA
ncbi:MAG TPA: CpsB/CapC family capsule biosynthesis tyrosine phosphatase [Thermoleophilaceae bacterium]|jgi:protein-tyrosine phosphatase